MTYTLVTRYEAAFRAGWGSSYAAARRVETRLVRAETLHHIQILEHGVRGASTMIRWELAAKYLPKPKSEVDSVRGANWREFLSTLDARIASGADRRIDQRVLPELRSLWERDEVIAKALRELAERMVKLTEADGS